LRIAEPHRQSVADGKAGCGIGFTARHIALPGKRAESRLQIIKAAHRARHRIGAAGTRRARQEIEFLQPFRRIGDKADAAAAQACRHRIGGGHGEKHCRHRIGGAATLVEDRRSGLDRERLVANRQPGRLERGGVGVIAQPQRGVDRVADVRSQRTAG
jgi:hypothetical protein